MFPHDITLSGKYGAAAGGPLRRTTRFSGLTQSSETVDVVPRGTDRCEAVTKFMDIRVNKAFNLGGRTKIDAMLDIFNLFNANHYLLEQESIGSRWGTPQRILSPRIIRFGFRISY